MKKMTKMTLLVAASVTALATQLQAELPVGSHYPIGAEGIKGADLPPPGFYVRDYNYFYTANKIDGLPMSANIFAFVEAPKLVWMTPWKILGANYACDTIIPFAYQSVVLPGHTFGQFNLGDVYFSPMLLSWHFKQFDIGAAYGIWAPSGDYSAKDPSSAGKGFWSHMITLGAVWHVDEEKNWSVSLLNRYESNTEQDQTHITPGDMLSMEWGISRVVVKGVELGVTGYWQQEISEDSGRGANTAFSDVVGVGPEIVVLWEKLGLISSLRYSYEVSARDRAQGQAFTLTLTKKF